MTGYNLPPGCSTSDLPGNKPTEQESIFEQVFARPELKGMSEKDADSLAAWVYELICDARTASYNEAKHDLLRAREEAAEQGPSGGCYGRGERTAQDRHPLRILDEK